MRLTHGATRIVLLIGRYAVKVPRFTRWRLFLCGLLANMQERNFATIGWPELCPVVFGLPGGWLLVMRRAKPLTEAEYDAFDGWLDGERIIPVECKPSSYGWLDGRVVAVDYGSNGVDPYYGSSKR